MTRDRSLPALTTLVAAACLACTVGSAATAFGRTGHYHERDSSGPREGAEIRSWRLDPIEDSDRVRLTFEIAWSDGGREVCSDDIAAQRLEGLDRTLFDGGRHEAAITLRRDAGTLHLSGSFDHGRGHGTFGFDPDPGFAQELARRDIGRPTFEQQLELALDDCTSACLDALRDAGYHGYDVAALVRMSDHGVDEEYVNGLARAGFRFGGVEQLVRAHDHGVDLDYVRGMKEAGFGSAGAEELARAHDHGVNAAYVEEMGSAGYTHLALDELIRARDHGVDGDYVKDLGSAGYAHAALVELIRAHDHGVSGRFARRVQARYGDDVSLERVIQLRARGLQGD